MVHRRTSDGSEVIKERPVCDTFDIIILKAVQTIQVLI